MLHDPVLDLHEVFTAEILAGRLVSDGFAVLFVPGGFAKNYEDALGKRGAANVDTFLHGGGGYVGECAGAYLGTEEYLGLLSSVSIIDIDQPLEAREVK